MFPPEVFENKWTFANARYPKTFLLRPSTETCNVTGAARRVYPRGVAVNTIRTPSLDGHRGPTPPRSPVDFCAGFTAALAVCLNSARSCGSYSAGSPERKGLNICQSRNHQWSSCFADCWPLVAKPSASRRLPVALSVQVLRSSRIPMLLKVLQSALARTFSTASFIQSAATKNTLLKLQNNCPRRMPLRGYWRLNEASQKNLPFQGKTAHV